MAPPTSDRSRKQHPAATAPKPRQRTLDVYTSTSTGHQVGSGVSKPSSWRKSRTSKLNEQFRNGLPPKNPPEATTQTKLRTHSAPTIVLSTGASTKHHVHAASNILPSIANPPPRPRSHSAPLTAIISGPQTKSPQPAPETKPPAPPIPPPNPKPKPSIFKGCRIYISGTTYPTISDRELKCLLASHGAHICTTLGRKTTTHVIVARPTSGTATSGGTGGGLAAGKLQKEIQSKANKIKYVSVQWAMDCMKQQKRLAESNYSILALHSGKQPSIMSMLSARSLENKENVSV